MARFSQRRMAVSALEYRFERNALSARTSNWGNGSRLSKGVMHVRRRSTELLQRRPGEKAIPRGADRDGGTSQAVRILVSQAATAIPPSQLLLDNLFNVLREAGVA